MKEKRKIKSIAIDNDMYHYLWGLWIGRSVNNTIINIITWQLANLLDINNPNKDANADIINKISAKCAHDVDTTWRLPEQLITDINASGITGTLCAKLRKIIGYHMDTNPQKEELINRGRERLKC